MGNKFEFQIKNRTAIFLWGFMAFWFLMLFTFAYLYVKEGISSELGNYMPVIFGVSFFFGIGALSWALKQPIVSIKIKEGRVLVSERLIFRVESFDYRVDEITVKQIKTDKDSEGDPYFKLEVEVQNKVFVVYECHSREEVEKRRNALLAAIKQ